MNNTVDTSHKSILKATGIFGFVQLVKIFLGVVSIKIVAVYLGSSGIGQLGLLQSVINVITAISGFGLQSVIVREISLFNKHNNFAKKLNLLHNWAFYIGIIGFILFIISAPFFLDSIFKQISWYWIILLGFQFVFSSLSNFRVSVLQGTQQLQKLALSQIVSAIIISVLSIVLYYFLGVKAIVYVLFSNAFVGFIILWYFTNGINVLPKFLPFIELKSELKTYFKTGALFSINIIFGYICTLIIKYFLKENANSIEIVGFYEVAITIMITYVGLVFTSMASDFYPRLTSITHLKDNSNVLINNQIQIALLLVVPIVVFIYTFGYELLSVFYTNSFYPVLEILKIGLFSVIIKAITWPLGFYLLAIGNTKQYFKQELIADFLNVSLSILGFHFFGLLGLGIAMCLNFFFYGIYISYILYKKYDFEYFKNTIQIIFFSLTFGILAIIFSFYKMKYLLFVLFLLVCVYTLYNLNKKINVREIFLKIKVKF